MCVDVHVCVCVCVFVSMYLSSRPKHCASRAAQEWKEGIVFQRPIVCGPFTSHFCTEPAFCSTGVSALPKRGLISPG